MRVKITYRDSRMNVVDTRDYSLSDYAAVMAGGIRAVISDVEDVLYDATKSEKGEWDPETIRKFEKIKHKLLDCAGSIERLEKNLYDEGDEQEGDISR